MRAVVTRVKEASVRIGGKVNGEIGQGFLILLGVGPEDTAAQAAHLAEKICNARVFEDAAGKMNLNLAAVAGSLLVVSQFTLAADCRRGRRPSFDAAAPPDEARRLYEVVVTTLRASGLPVETGEFQADMQVALVNDGPVTFVLESRGA